RHRGPFPLLAAVILGQPAAPPRLRVGLADPLPGPARQRARDALPAVLPAGPGPCRRPGHRAAHPDPDLHGRPDGHHGLRRPTLRPNGQTQDLRHLVRRRHGRRRRPARALADVAGAGYPVLYLLTAVVTLLGSWLVTRIRAVP